MFESDLLYCTVALISESSVQNITLRNQNRCQVRIRDATA